MQFRYVSLCCSLFKDVKLADLCADRWSYQEIDDWKTEQSVCLQCDDPTRADAVRLLDTVVKEATEDTCYTICISTHGKFFDDRSPSYHLYFSDTEIQDSRQPPSLSLQLDHYIEQLFRRRVSVLFILDCCDIDMAIKFWQDNGWVHPNWSFIGLRDKGPEGRLGELLRITIRALHDTDVTEGVSHRFCPNYSWDEFIHQLNVACADLDLEDILEVRGPVLPFLPDPCLPRRTYSQQLPSELSCLQSNVDNIGELHNSIIRARTSACPLNVIDISNRSVRRPWFSDDLFPTLVHSILSSPRNLLFLHGCPGSGKTTALREFFLRLQEERELTLHLPAVCVLGLSASKLDTRQLMQDVVLQLHWRKLIALHELTMPVNGDDYYLNLLDSATAGGTDILLLVDALDEAKSPDSLKELFYRILSHCNRWRIIASVRDSCTSSCSISDMPLSAGTFIPVTTENGSNEFLHHFDFCLAHHSIDVIRNLAKEIGQSCLSSTTVTSSFLANNFTKEIVNTCGSSILLAILNFREMAQNQGLGDWIPGSTIIPSLKEIIVREIAGLSPTDKVRLVYALHILSLHEGNSLPLGAVWARAASILAGRDDFLSSSHLADLLNTFRKKGYLQVSSYEGCPTYSFALTPFRDVFTHEWLQLLASH
ncbi:ATP-binding protein [Buchananella hordeovulneris]|uniref:AAA family ATPase n=1 Tax=Buchananella hordeovulneris TaxID=52770 RepID=UPI000F5E61DB|nr:ATP-binding protein [Buchananella hordeovulneris]RRD52109.1 ATP-binding protein [Buchananella hordeovulneris]